MRTHGRPPQSHPSDRFDRLLEAAAGLFARWGFDKTSVDDIAREAGISKGAVYLEFPPRRRSSRPWCTGNSPATPRTGCAASRRTRVPGVRPDDSAQHRRRECESLVKALVTRDQRIYGNFLQRDPELLGLAVSMRTELFGQMQQVGAMREDIAAPVIAYLVSIIGYGLVAGAEVIPEAQRVPFEDALRALGLLLDRGLSPRARPTRKRRAPC